MLKIYLNGKNVRLWASVLAGAAIMTTTGCSQYDGKTDVRVNYVSEADNSMGDTVTTIETSETKTFVTTDASNIVASSETEEIIDNEENNNVLDNAKPVIIELTAENIISMSNMFADYVNKNASLSHTNYKFSEIKPEDLYSVVYLANIDFVSKEETARLIDKHIISDNINDNVANSFYFYELYADDTINKIQEGKTNIMSLTPILLDEHDISVSNQMTNIMKDSITASSDVNYKNYIDTAFYYANGTTLYNTDYDFSKSIYETDRDKLTVGGDYTISYQASCIDEIMKFKGVANRYASDMMYEGRVDFSNLANVFNGCKLPEQEKVFVK